MSRKPHAITPTPKRPGAYARLPEQVRLEDTVTSEEAIEYPQEKNDYWREVEWMLRVSGGV